jgi:hypothetical protein
VREAAFVTGISVTRDAGGPVRLLCGRFEAQFEDSEAAQAAARDARAVGFVVDVQRGIGTRADSTGSRDTVEARSPSSWKSRRMRAECRVRRIFRPHVLRLIER